jgi:hypothetical protein
LVAVDETHVLVLGDDLADEFGIIRVGPRVGGWAGDTALDLAHLPREVSVVSLFFLGYDHHYLADIRVPLLQPDVVHSVEFEKDPLLRTADHLRRVLAPIDEILETNALVRSRYLQIKEVPLRLLDEQLAFFRGLSLVLLLLQSELALRDEVEGFAWVMLTVHVVAIFELDTFHYHE